MGNAYKPGVRETRPWGEWEVLGVGVGYAVKRLTIWPGGRLSLQRHRHRHEHWHVVTGSPTLTSGQLRRSFGPGESLEIGVGMLHRIENDGTEVAVVIEVQRGSLLDEADIERVEDSYGRV